MKDDKITVTRNDLRVTTRAIGGGQHGVVVELLELERAEMRNVEKYVECALTRIDLYFVVLAG